MSNAFSLAKLARLLKTGNSGKVLSVDSSGSPVANPISQIQSITASVGSSALTCTLNPTSLDFRSTPLTSGVVNTRIVGTAISIVVPSTATLGTISAQQSRLILLAIDYLGTVELAIVNIAGGNNLDETTLITTTTIAGASNAANVAYSTTGRTGVPFRVVGYIESTQATAGTWATAPSTIQGYGGQALATMSSLGYSQTWQVVTRASGVTYYNTTGRPIHGIYGTAGSGAGTAVSISINGGASIILGQCNLASGTAVSTGQIIIPPNATYVITVSSGTLGYATELR